MLQSADIYQIMLQCLHKPWEWPLLIGQFLILSKQVKQWSKSYFSYFLLQELVLVDKFCSKKRRSYSVMQTSRPHCVGTRNGKSAIPSAFALKQPWPSGFHKIRGDCSVPSVCNCTSAAVWPFTLQAVQCWWNPYDIQAFADHNPRIQWQQKSSSEVLCAEKRGFKVTLAVTVAAKTTTFGDFQRCTHSKKASCFQTLFEYRSTRKAGWMQKVRICHISISKLTGNWCNAQMTDRLVLSIYSNWVFCYLFQEWRSGFIPVCRGILAINGHYLFGILS